MMDFESMTPKQLRDEATRRELVEQHRQIAERRAARCAVAASIVAIPSGKVYTANATQLLRGVLDELVAADAAEEGPTNGDISMVSTGMDINWWQQAIKDHPRTEDPILDRIKRRRIHLWSSE